MAGLAQRAILVSLSRFANQGLMVISPIVLVRLLPVEVFGKYREFILYATILFPFSTFIVNESLLYFVPKHPERTWLYVRQAAISVLATSTVVLALLAAADLLTGGLLIGANLLPLVFYVLFYVNVDFWEALFVAQGKPFPLVAYATGRLAARMTVVVVAAVLTEDVATIVWSLVCLEALRLLGSVILWRMRAAAQPDTQAPTRSEWREQVTYCAPAAGAVVLNTGNRYVGSILVAKIMGPVALAHYTIGMYVDAMISPLRDSVSEVMLPEMVSRQAGSVEQPLELWKRVTVVYAILLIPAAILLARFADTIVVQVFSEEYRSSVAVFQIYSLLLVRECFDFWPPLRAMQMSKYSLHSSFLGLVINLGLAYLLLPILGLVGAIVSLVVAHYAECIYQGWRTAQVYKTTVLQMIPCRQLGKVLLCAAIASVVVLGIPWTASLGLLGVFLGSAAFLAVFILILHFMHVQEAVLMMGKVRAMVFGAPA